MKQGHFILLFELERGGRNLVLLLKLEETFCFHREHFILLLQITKMLQIHTFLIFLFCFLAHKLMKLDPNTNKVWNPIWYDQWDDKLVETSTMQMVSSDFICYSSSSCSDFQLDQKRHASISDFIREYMFKFPILVALESK